MVWEAIEELNLKYLDFYLIDASAPVDNSFLLFYDSDSQEFIEDEELAKQTESKLSEFCREESNCSRKLLVADRQWLLLIRPQPRFVGKRWETEATLAIGLLLSSMVAIYLGLSIRRTLDLEAAMEQLQKTQLQLLQVEKMSSLGELVAGVAHEINNPTSFIYGNIDHTSEYIKNLLELIELYREQYPEPSEEIEEFAEEIELEFIEQDLPKTLASMKSGAERIKNIVLSLRTFSHMDESDLKTVEIHQGIDSTLMILQSRLNPTAGHEEIAVVKEYGDLPPVECYAGQLNQVFLNIIANGIDAIKQRLSEQPEIEKETDREQSGILAPEIRIRTEAIPGKNPEDAGRVAIIIADNGVGIKKENLDRVFNPFFTTKPVGSGTGLGLSISYKIIAEKHGGNLECVSEPGKGTEFIIEIPVKQTV
ncbi:MAG: HAMP domain-containing histidine kinase [Oscillatoria sp. SIO1A7]|nr:HAMP domain-containing histidine kinase [Oscillatoria sp. SIO1A7]